MQVEQGEGDEDGRLVGQVGVFVDVPCARHFFRLVDHLENRRRIREVVDFS